MATGIESELDGEHDALYDYKCTPCLHRKLNARAEKYCKDCQKLFCDACALFHDGFFSGHQVFGRDNTEEWRNVSHVTQTITCDLHHGKELEMYCVDDEQICCSVCVNIYHRFCNQVQHVSDVAKGIQRNPEYRSLFAGAEDIQEILTDLKERRQSNLDLLKKACDDMRASVQDMRQQLIHVINKLEEDSLKNLDRIQLMLKGHIQRDVDDITSVCRKIQRLISDMKALEADCETYAFQAFKQVQQHLSDAENLIATTNFADHKIHLTPDPYFEDCLSSLKNLGNLHVSQSFPADHLYSVALKKLYSVRTQEDENTCSINGICLLPDGQVAVVDTNNRKVKCLNTPNFSVVDQLVLPHDPFDICLTTGSELAVSVFERTWTGKDYKISRSQAHFINAENGKLTKTKVIKFKHECIGIAYSNNQLFVGSCNVLYIYSLSGQLLKNIYNNQTPNVALSTVCRFCVSDNGNRIYVTNVSSDSLITLDGSGQSVSELFDDDVKLPSGICTADDGKVFLCGRDSNIVVQVDSEGERIMTTLETLYNDMYQPQALCYSKKTQHLLVGQFYTDYILVVKLK